MDLAAFIVGRSSPGSRLEEWGNSLGVYGALSAEKTYGCFTLLTNYLCINSLEYLKDVDAAPLDLVSGIRNFFHMVLIFRF